MTDTLIVKRGGVRTVWLDNLKAIAIILMVLGHSGAPFTHWIFLFHMAVFYIAAGYTWNNKHVKSRETLGSYLLNKVKTLYVPFILCNILFLLLNNFFVTTGIYVSSEEDLQLIGANKVSQVHTMMTPQMMVKPLVKIFLLMGGTELGGPTWFFGSLFLSLCIFAIIEYVANRLLKGNQTNVRIFEGIIAVFSVMIAWLISEDRIGFLMFNRSFAAYPLLVVGKNLKIWDKQINWKPFLCLVVCLLAFAILYVMNNFGSISMARCKIENPLYFLIVSMAGWYFLASISRLIPATRLAKLGASTRSVVMWHFASMKLVTLAYIFIMGLPMVYLGAFPYLSNTPSWMWIVYTTVGILMPVLLGVIYDKVKERMIKQNG